MKHPIALPAVFAAGLVLAVIHAPQLAHAECAPAKKQSIMDELVDDDPAKVSSSVRIDCPLTLNFDDLSFPAGKPRVVKRPVLIVGSAASGTQIDCANHLLDGSYWERDPNIGWQEHARTVLWVRSHWEEHEDENGEPYMDWSRPENVTVKNCRIKGSTLTAGIALTANYDIFSIWQTLPTYVEYLRARAPRRITFDNVDITGVSQTPIYLGPGTSEFTLKNSTITGTANHTGIYLGAETTRNVFRNNDIHVDVPREQIAVDASDYNQFIDNRFADLGDGGIYLYRNCGEAGNSRRTTPSHNQIVGNTFSYNVYTGDNPAIYLGSRDGDKPYCDKDDDSPFGSGVSDFDYARYNIVLANQIINRSVSDMIKTRDRYSYPNYILYNTNASAPTSRPLACAVPDGYRRKGLLHGESLELWEGINGVPLCTGQRVTCVHGELQHSTTSDCPLQRVDFACSNGNATECNRAVACPAGSALVATKAVCDLKYASTADMDLAATRINTVRVMTSADESSQGMCWVGLDSGSEGQTDIDVDDLGGWRASIGCLESASGHSCEIRGSLYCQSWGNQSRQTDDLVWQSNSGQMHFWPMRDGQRLAGVDVSDPVNPAWVPKDMGDLNGDGVDDVVFRQNNGQVHYWPIKNGQRQNGINIDVPVGSAWTLRALGDVNGDGTDDIIWQHSGGKVYIWPMLNAQRQGGYGVHSPVGSDWTLAGAGDVDGDGTDDIVWRHSTGRVHYWRMSNGLRVGGYDIGTVPATLTIAAVGDVNGDGTDDLVFKILGGELRVWAMDNGHRADEWDIQTPDSGSWTLVGAGNLDAPETFPWSVLVQQP